MKRPRVYPDTSVFGGCFDVRFEQASGQFSREVHAGRFVIVISDVTIRELQQAPERVREVLTQLPEKLAEQFMVDEEVLALRDAFLAAGVVSWDPLLKRTPVISRRQPLRRSTWL